MENKRISVLLIEDSIDDAELIKRKLEKSASTKFRIAVTHRLEDGLKQAETDEPDLIVSDLGLPDSHGLDTVTKILLALPHVPLVVLSGFDDEETGIKAVQSGAQDYLVKGRLDETQLERSIYYSIERARLQYELEQNSQEISKLHVNLLKILENSTDATVVVGENGDILFSNPAVESLFGQKPKDLLNQSFQYPLAGGKTSEIEIYKTDGIKNIAEMNVVNISWEGRPARLVSMHNITKRKAMEEALRASEEKYRNIVEQSNEGIIITNVQGIITSCNVTFLDMIGLPQEEIVGQHFKDIPNINIKDLPTYIKMFASLILGKKSSPLEIPWKVADGSTRLFELRSNLMKSNGDIFGVQTIVTDITERKQMEQALRESEEKFSKSFHALPEEVAISRMKDGAFIEVNDTFCRNNRCTREEVIGRKAEELNLAIKPNEWDQVKKMIKQRGRAENVELELRDKSGKMQTLLFSTDIINLEGEPCLLTIGKDITERKQMEQALRESEEKFSKAFNASPEAIAIVSSKDDKFIEVNESSAQMTGYSREEMIGKTVASLNIWINPEDFTKMRKMLQEQGRFYDEVEYRTKSGEIRIRLLSVEPITISGEPCTIGVSIDITERKQMERALKESEEKFSKAFHTSPEAIAIVSAKDDRYLDINDNYAKMTGYSREELIGNVSSLYNWVNSADLDKTNKLMQEHGRIHNEELEYRTKTGEIRTRLFSLEPITINGEPCRIGFSLDITERKRMEQAVKESEEKFSKSFHALPEQLALIRIEDYKIVDVNDSFCRNNGYTREEAIGHNGEELNLLIGPGQWDRVIKTVKEQGRAENMELECRDKSGETRILLFSADTINIGGETYLLTIANDISQRKQMEQAVRESEEKFAKAFLNSPEIIVISTIDDGEILEVNNTFLNFYGYAREEVIGKKANETNTWADLAERAEVMKVLMKDGVVRNRECHFRKKNGEISTSLFSAEIINIGDRRCMLSVTTDITERKQMEEDLKQSEEKYRELINTSTDAIISADPKMRATIWNHGAEKIFGYTESEMLGQSVLKIVPEAHRKEMFEGFIHLNKTGLSPVSEKIIETTALRKNGTQVPIELSISTRRAGDILIATGIIRDITARKETEEKLHKIDQMKSEFLSNVSHELRTPLQSISGFTKLIMAGKVPDPTTQQEFLQIIDGETTHLGNLINSLLDMSRLESGRFQIYKKNVSMGDVIADCMKTLRGLAHEKNITLTESVPKQLPEMEADNERIRQVIFNLVGNAIKFSDRGSSINIKVAVKNSELLFQVIDHGIGIEEEAIPHLFERFYRAEGETGRGGTGLGLYISKQIIDAHEGQIWVESKHGEGSTFSFTLPLNGKGGDKHGKEDSNNRRRPGNTKTGRLLTKAGGVPDNHGS